MSSIHDSTGNEVLIKQISSKDKNEIAFILALMHKAFPYYAERDNGDFVKGLEGTDPVEVYCLYMKDICIGFYCLWRLEQITYIEYRGLEEEYQGRSIMSRVFKHIIAEEKNPVVTEVQRPIVEVAARRFKFYERLGFIVLDEAYVQPPATKEDTPPIMCLILHPAQSSTKLTAKEVTKILYDKVYYDRECPALK